MNAPSGTTLIGDAHPAAFVQSLAGVTKMNHQATAYIVGGDQHVLLQVNALAEELKLQYESYDSVDEFLSQDAIARPGCVLAGDTALAEQLQQQFRMLPASIPLIVAGSNLSVESAVRFMRNGIFTVLEIPFSSDRLASAFVAAIRLDSKMVALLRRFEELERCERGLTERKRTVLALLMKGASNKAIARELDLSVSTVEMHRAQIVRQFDVKTSLELVAGYAELRVLANTLFRFDPPAELLLRLSAGCGGRDSR